MQYLLCMDKLYIHTSYLQRGQSMMLFHGKLFHEMMRHCSEKNQRITNTNLSKIYIYEIVSLTVHPVYILYWKQMHGLCASREEWISNGISLTGKLHFRVQIFLNAQLNPCTQVLISQEIFSKFQALIKGVSKTK